jgi:putative transposase
MPWRNTSPMHERQRFVIDAQYTPTSFHELCRRYGISRKTGYKWIHRYRDEGLEALGDRSHRPRSCSHATPPEIVRDILKLQKRWNWGAPKIQDLLLEKWPPESIPAISTIHRILKRHGRVKTPRRSRIRAHPGKPTAPITEPNGVWTTDFKGEFKTKDGIYCYPLTVQDSYSRFLLACQGFTGNLLIPTNRTFKRLFMEYGLPLRIRSDNGTPFASTALGRLSQLSVWWIQLGITPELIEPAHPEQNPRHERMHRTLKDDTTKPPSSNLTAQQRRFNKFIHTFNYDRPHEALGQQRPVKFYEPSPRPYPKHIPPIEYPAHFEIRRVSKNGGIRWNARWVNVSHVLQELPVGLEPIADGTWNVFFGPVHLGWLDERDYRIHDHRGRTKRG